MPNPFTTTALLDGRAAYAPDGDAHQAVMDKLAEIERLDGRAMSRRDCSRYKVHFWIGWVSERMRQRAQQRRTA
jgi:hypothetical protein